MASIALDFRLNNGLVLEGSGIATTSTLASNGLQLANAGAAIGQNLIVGSTATVWGNSKLYGLLNVDGVTTLNNDTSAASNSLGALVVSGGAYFGNNLYVAGTASSLNNTTSNSIFTMGGLGVAKDGTFGGNLVVSGNFTVLGTQTIINSTGTAIIDPVIDLGTAYNNQPLPGNDGYNKGIVIHYYDTDDNHMFIGRNNVTGNFVFKQNIDPGYSGAIPNADYVNSGTYSTIDLGTLLAHDTQSSVNTTTGAIRALGGIASASSIYAGSTLTGATVVANNLVSNRVVFSINGKLVDDAGLFYNTATQLLSGTITTANTASNIAAGLPGNVVYQTGIGKTGFVTNGSIGQILLFDGSMPYWGTPGGISAGLATTATNIQYGLTGQVPFQYSPGKTAFSTNFIWSTLTDTLSILNAAVTGTTNSTGTDTGALVVAGGVGIGKDVNVGGSINVAGQLSFGGTSGTIVLSATTASFVAITITGPGTSLVSNGGASFNGTVGATGLVVSGNSALGATTATTLTVTNLTVSGSETVGGSLNVANTTTTKDLVVTNFANITSATINTATIATLSVTSGLTIGGSTFNANGGITSTGTTYLGNVTAVNVTFTNLTVTGTSVVAALTATAFTATSANILGNVSIAGTLGVAQQTTLAGVTGTTSSFVTLQVTSTSTLSTTSNMAVVIAGGVSVGKDLLVFGNSTLAGVTADSLTVNNLTVNTNTTIGNNLSVGNVFTSTTANITGQLTANNIAVSTTATFGGRVSISDSTNAASTNFASFITAGGIGVAKDAIIGGAANIGAISTGTVVPAVYTNNMLLASYTSPTITGVAPVNLDTYSSTTYRSAKYFVQIVDGTSVHITEINLFHDGTNVFKTEYGIATNHGELGTFDATLSTGVITLNFSPANAVLMTIKVVRLGITA
jgi:carbonic anhydrase/acetyltransferase-like protein (isoleucine patch superfamily)